MPAFFSVIRYVPDPLADERMNIGVIVFGPSETFVKFVERWDRVRGFGGEDVSFLRDFADLVRDRQLPLLETPRLWSEEVLQKALGGWSNSIQFSLPKVSTKPASELLPEIARRYLRGTASQRQHRARDKRAIVHKGVAQLNSALTPRIGDERLQRVLHRGGLVQGKLEHHHFDIVVANGSLALAAQGLSFEKRDTLELHREADAAKWSMDDVQKTNPEALIAVLAIPPRHESKIFDNLTRVVEGLGGEVVREGLLNQWAERSAEKIAKRIH
jgi:hypothetical protein